jgi:hypothetical protein
MKTLSLFCLLWFTSSLYGYDVQLRVVDERGFPVPDAKAKIIFVMILNGTDDARVGSTGKDGAFSASGRGENSVMVKVTKEGHYDAQIERLEKDKDHSLTVVMPRVVNPIPLYAATTSTEKYSRGIRIPEQDKWLGFDLEAGDWVAPHGKGEVTDIRFKFRNEFKGYSSTGKSLERAYELSKKSYAVRREEWTEEKFRLTAGKWDAELEISFPGEKEGLIEVKEQFLPYSQMKMPHQAATDGYAPARRYTAKTYSQAPTRNDVGFFLRTRVKLGEQGNIVSAHYSKVMGDFHVAATGGITFTYYFNPMPNDRNLEFDPKRNLFPKDKPGANVFNP